MRFRSVLSAPPGGVWFWEDGGHFVSGPDYGTVVSQVRRILREKGDSADPEAALAGYMCPRMPRGFCAGVLGFSKPTLADYLKAAAPYFLKPVAMADDIERRMEVCRGCPRLVRDAVCIPCRHADEAVYAGFGGRRVRLPGDRRSGICGCAGTFNMAVASVVYGDRDPVWAGTPAECWRHVR